MIFGEYPCCGGPLCLGVPERTPAYAPEDCPHCGAKVWHVFSRVDPETYLEAEFLAKYEINEATHVVRERDPA